MTKFKQAYLEMFTAHQVLFEEFKEVHDKYAKDQVAWQKKFDELGKPIQKLVLEAENRLCGKMENSGRGKFADNVADKFRAEVKQYLPYIDMVGVIVE